MVANGGALAEKMGNSVSWQSLDLLPNLPFPSTSRHVIVGQYQSIGLLDAQPTTWMLNWQTSAVHHCRPKQPVKPKGKTPISAELVLVSDCLTKVFQIQDVFSEEQLSIDIASKSIKVNWCLVLLHIATTNCLVYQHSLVTPTIQKCEKMLYYADKRDNPLMFSSGNFSGPRSTVM